MFVCSYIHICYAESRTDIDVIVAAVLVPFAVMLILLLLLATALFGCRKKKENIFNVRSVFFFDTVVA